MSKKVREVVIIVGILGIIILFCLFNALAKRIPSNPPGTVGNTAGNLNNGGLFCEDDGIVYFANAYDSGTLYSMNSDESDMRKLSNAQVEFINSGGSYLYYYQSNSASATPFAFLKKFNGIYRTHKRNLHSICLSNAPSILVQLCDNTLYYQHFGDDGTTLYKVAIDNGTPEQVTDYLVNPASVQNGLIYFNGTEYDHYLYSLNTADDSIQTVWNSNLWNPVAVGDYIYYMDLNTNYNLCRYSLTDQKVTVLSTERVEFFNVYNNYIYFQTNSPTAPALKRLTLDGYKEEIVMEGVFEHINITSEYVYFNKFQEPVPVYKTSTEGPVLVSTFDAAMQAVMDVE